MWRISDNEKWPLVNKSWKLINVNIFSCIHLKIQLKSGIPFNEYHYLHSLQHFTISDQKRGSPL